MYLFLNKIVCKYFQAKSRSNAFFPSEFRRVPLLPNRLLWQLLGIQEQEGNYAFTFPLGKEHRRAARSITYGFVHPNGNKSWLGELETKNINIASTCCIRVKRSHRRRSSRRQSRTTNQQLQLAFQVSNKTGVCVDGAIHGGRDTG